MPKRTAAVNLHRRCSFIRRFLGILLLKELKYGKKLLKVLNYYRFCDIIQALI